MTNIQEINDVEGLAALRLAWKKLLAETRGATFFHTLEWLEAYWRHFGADQRLRVIVVRDIAEIVGIVPLVVRREPTRIGHVRTLTYPLHDWGSFYGPIGPEPTATLRAALAHVRSTRRDWDVVDLRWIDPNVDHGRTGDAMVGAGFRPVDSPYVASAFIDLEQPWDEYWANRSAHWRKNCRRAARILEEQGRVEHIRYRTLGASKGDDDPRWDLYDACEAVAAQSWQGSSTTGTTLSHASIRPFMRDAHAAAARAGAVDINLLTLDGRPIAFAYCYVWAGTVNGIRMGYAPGEGRASVGLVLTWRMIEDSFRRGDKIFDLGPAYLDCKRPWMTHLVTSRRCLHYPRMAPRAQALRLKRWIVGSRLGPHETADVQPGAKHA